VNTVIFNISLCAVLVFNITLHAQSSTQQEQDTARIVLLVGQSNAMGLGSRSDLTADELKVYHRLQILAPWTKGFEAYQPGHPEKSWIGNSKGWHKQSPGHLPINKGVGFGLELSLGQALLEVHDTVYLVKMALGASNLNDHWMGEGIAIQATDSLIGKAIEHFMRNGRIPHFEMIVWHQGESDAVNLERSKKYQKRFDAVINHLYELTGSDTTTPLFITTIGSASFPFAEKIRTVHRMYAQKNKFSYFVETDDLEFLSDKIHLSGNGLRALGHRIFEIYRTL